ncbi:MAG: hypothetical protein NTV94_08770 [Planctomycetota bacterium]|nr:hypothetical protein [Planctomycetota bacterium]
MVKSTIRWTFILAVLLLVGPMIGWLARSMHDVHGGHSCSLLVSGTAARGVMVAMVTAATGLVLGAIASRLFSLGTGLACAGFCYTWAAWNLGTVEGIVRTSGGGASLMTLGIEGAVLMVLAAATVHACTRAAAGAQPVDPERSVPSGIGSLLAKAAPQGTGLGPILIAAAIGAVSGGLVASIFAVNGLKGQSLFAAIAAGVACGLAASSVAGSSKVVLHPLTPMLGMVLLALVGPMVAKFMHGSHLLELMYQDKMFPLSRILSVDWVAGALLGVPIGMGWGGVVLDVRSVEHPEPV